MSDIEGGKRGLTHCFRLAVHRPHCHSYLVRDGASLPPPPSAQ
jgi:hypothetical protein